MYEVDFLKPLIVMMGRETKAILFIVFFVKLARPNNQEETQQTKPDPYFQEWRENAWRRPSRCHGKLGNNYEYSINVLDT